MMRPSEQALPAIKNTRDECGSVLLADDDPITRAMVGAWLRKWHFSLTKAEDGAQAWELLQREEAPPLILLDWMMPGFSGVELCRKIRARKTRRYPYILLLTASHDRGSLIEALDAGADDYLTKPLDIGEFRARLRVGCRIVGLQDELLRREEELRFEASHDHLTGLWNRSALFGFMEREIARSVRSGSSLGLLLIDIDHFKRINDENGHQAGDVVLDEVATRLRLGVRKYDWAGRYGGEEFLVVLTNCTGNTAVSCAERLRRSIAAEPVRIGARELHVTASIGASLFLPGDAAMDEEEWLRRADVALYRAKQNGRDRVEISW